MQSSRGATSRLGGSREGSWVSASRAGIGGAVGARDGEIRARVAGQRGLKEKPWPPMEASNMRPVLVMVKTATPLA